MLDKDIPPGPKAKQGLQFLLGALMFTVLGTVIFDEGITQTIILICAAVIAICAVVLVIQGRKEDSADAS